MQRIGFQRVARRFLRGPVQEPCARKILGAIATRAYRRPTTEQDLKTLLEFYRAGRSEGGSFDAGIQRGLERILAAPSFLFRIEQPPAGASAGTVYRLSDLELASRLSFFLWSSGPDETLLNLASQGKLRDPAVLEQQVRRLLADDRSEALAKNFKVCKVNLDKDQELASHYGISSIPALVFFKGGKEVHRIVGYVKKDKLVDEIKKHLLS